jgi:hypothetical protein
MTRRMLAAVLFVASPAFAQSADTVRVEVHVARPQAALGLPMPASFKLGGPGLGRDGIRDLKVLVRTEAGQSLTDPREASLSEDLHELRTSRLTVGQDGVLQVEGDLEDWAVFREPGRYQVVVTHEVAGAPPIRSQPMLVVVERRSAPELTKQYQRVALRARDTNARTRADAMRELGYLGNPDALPILVGALYDDDAMVARWAAASLSRLPDRLAVRAALRTARQDRGLSGPLVAALFRAGERVVGLGADVTAGAGANAARERRRSVEAAGVIGRLGPDACAGQMLPVVRQAVGDRDESVVHAAFEALAGWHDAGSRDALQSHVAPGPTLERAVSSLARRRDPESRAFLRDTLRSRDVALRMAAARALWHAGDRSGRGVFIAVLRARDAAAKQALMAWLTTEIPLETVPPADESGAGVWRQIVERMP